MKHAIKPLPIQSVTNLEGLIRRKIQSREKQITINAMAILPESAVSVPPNYKGIRPYHGSKDNQLQNSRIMATINQCQASIEKLLVIGDVLNTVNYREVQQLLSCNAFDEISMEDIHTILELKKATYSEKIMVGLMITKAARSSEMPFSGEFSF